MIKKIFIWGTGYVAEKVFNQCRTLNQYEFVGAIDNDRNKWGQMFHGLRIDSPEILLKKKLDAIVILSDRYAEIKRQIEIQYPKLIAKVENKNFFYKESILLRYRDNTDPEIAEVIENIKKNGLDVFNYSFVEKYRNQKNQVWKDEETGLFFVVHNGKRMYFPQKYRTKKEVNDYYNARLREQDEMSPHRYLTGKCSINEGDVVLDVGAAEGIFSLDVIDKASHIYLFESDDNWIRALLCTFKEYKDKVTIVKGLVDSYNEGENITIDSVVDTPVDFIKMDIEGMECDALLGAEKIINKSPKVKFSICCYHADYDQLIIESIMDNMGIRHNTSSGYMWFPYLTKQNYVSTKLTKALVRGQKIM